MELVIKSFNIHCGGVRHDWSGKYDVQAQLEPFVEDIIVLQECLPLAYSGLCFPSDFNVEVLNLFPSMRTINNDGDYHFVEGHLILATKLRVVERYEIPLRRFGRDPRDRVLCVVVEKDGIRFNVIGVHLTTAYLPIGSFFQSIQLGNAIPEGPTLVVGDHNLWRTPLRIAYAKKLHHAGKGASWPSRRPMHQIDHIWFSNFEVIEYNTLPAAGSDHLAIRARLTFKP